MGLSEEFEYLTVEWQIIVVPLTLQFLGVRYTGIPHFHIFRQLIAMCQGLHTENRIRPSRMKCCRDGFSTPEVYREEVCTKP